MSLFSSFSQGVNKIKKNAGKIQDMIIKESLEKLDPGKAYGSLWEVTENAEYCRSCDVKFVAPLVNIKHHCRSCAGVFCDTCCQNVDLNEYYLSIIPPSVDTTIIEKLRLCEGCKHGESPGQLMKDRIKIDLDELIGKSTENNSISKIQQMITSKVNESIGIRPDSLLPQSKRLTLAYGSFYGEDGKTRKNTNRPIAVSGYFEIFNKSNEIFCIKIIIAGGNTKFEIPRPSYFAGFFI
jgi:hypothetical protein